MVTAFIPIETNGLKAKRIQSFCFTCPASKHKVCPDHSCIKDPRTPASRAGWVSICLKKCVYGNWSIRFNFIKT